MSWRENYDWRRRLAMETDDERRARLEQLSANQHLRLAAETNSEKAAQLEHLSANQHLRLSAETNDKGAARLQRQSPSKASFRAGYLAGEKGGL